MISLHADAVTNYNQKAKSLIDLFKPFVPPEQKPTNNDMDIIREFFNISWSVFKMIIRNMDNFESKEELLSEIDKIKYA